MLTSRNHLVLVLDSQSKYEKAEKMHQQVLKLKKKMLNSEHSSILTSMSNLVLAFMYQNKYQIIEKIY